MILLRQFSSLAGSSTSRSCFAPSSRILSRRRRRRCELSACVVSRTKHPHERVLPLNRFLETTAVLSPQSHWQSKTTCPHLRTAVRDTTVSLPNVVCGLIFEITP